MRSELEKTNCVNGFVFGSADDVELAKQELNTAKYIDKKIDNKSPETVLAIYKAAIEKKIFRTPVGYAYLHSLQKKMIGMGINGDDINGIPIYQIYSEREAEKPPRIIQVEKKTEPLKKANRILTLINIVLVIMVIIMFAISVSGNSATVLNYRHAIENEYSSWKQELDEREKAIRDKEREMVQDGNY